MFYREFKREKPNFYIYVLEKKKMVDRKEKKVEVVVVGMMFR